MKTKIVDLITKSFQPESIFNYGSRARTDCLDKSDYDIGVIFSDANFVSRMALKKAINLDGVSAYPFHLNDFKNGMIDTPFQKSIFSNISKT
ncbi:MAG: hypothetical protein WCJ19_00135 [bacterium]